MTKLEWKPIEPGKADRTSISQSLRIEPLELRRDAAFERVYELSPQVRLFGGERVLARRAGNTTAIFPLSTYVPTRKGLVPVVPPGTVFLIGDPDARDLGGYGPGEAASPAGVMFVDLAADLRPRAPDARATAVAPTRPAANPTIWTSEEQRGHRLEVLLTRATRAG